MWALNIRNNSEWPFNESSNVGNWQLSSCKILLIISVEVLLTCSYVNSKSPLYVRPEVVIFPLVSSIKIFIVSIEISTIISSWSSGRNVIDKDESSFAIPVIVPENSLRFAPLLFASSSSDSDLPSRIILLSSINHENKSM